MKVLALLGAVLLGSTGALAHEFQKCAPDKLGVQSVELHPDPVVPGKKLQVNVIG